MKLKRLPEDFVVQELADLEIASSGKYTLYELHKRSIGTLEAIAAITKRWKISRPRLSWGGLKDKHAVTSQFVTIAGGAARDLQQTNLELKFLGYVAEPFTPKHIRGNRFALVLRDLGHEEAQRVLDREKSLRRFGVPNYFGDQRFGSITSDGDFIAEPWMRGDYERTLWLALAAPHDHDSSAERKDKALLRSYWGQWEACARELRKSLRRDIIGMLKRNEGGFKSAWAAVDKDLRGLYLAAYQSMLWNETLSRMIQRTSGSEQAVATNFKSGIHYFPSLDNLRSLCELQSVQIPLPSSRLSLDDVKSELVRSCLQEVLTARGIELREIRTKYPRDSFFAKGERRAYFEPENCSSQICSDNLYPGKQRLDITFELPRGSYATVMLKYLGIETNDDLIE